MSIPSRVCESWLCLSVFNLRIHRDVFHLPLRRRSPTRALKFRNPDLIIPALQHCEKEIFIANLRQLEIAAQAGWNTRLRKQWKKMGYHHHWILEKLGTQSPRGTLSPARAWSSLDGSVQCSHVQVHLDLKLAELCRLTSKCVAHPDETQAYAHPCWFPFVSRLTRRSHPLCACACVRLIILASFTCGSQKKPRTGEHAHDRYQGEKLEEFNSSTESHACWWE